MTHSNQSTSESNKAQIRNWLTNEALPLWIDKGVDRKDGGFVEDLSLSGAPLTHDKRTLVQMRQIYSLKKATDLNACSLEKAKPAIVSGLGFIFTHCSQPSGAFMRSVTVEGQPSETNLDLYTQAFILFGLAQSYSLLRDQSLKQRALKLMKYLERERQSEFGGFFELSAGQKIYVSNPHMHLFEAFLAWVEVDDEPIWKEWANKIFSLCVNHFIDKKTGLLAEFFDENWNPIRNAQGLFIAEAGHQYEWSWLLNRCTPILGIQRPGFARKLFDQAEEFGLCAIRRSAFDDSLSDRKVNRSTSRLWPQCERIKSALAISELISGDEKIKYQAAADEALGVLFRYFETEVQGLWFDGWNPVENSAANAQFTQLSDFAFTQGPVRASSLYHIMGALGDYLEKR